LTRDAFSGSGLATYAIGDIQGCHAELVDLLTLSGTYTTLAMMMNAVEQGVPPGTTPPLQPIPAK